MSGGALLSGLADGFAAGRGIQERKEDREFRRQMLDYMKTNPGGGRGLPGSGSAQGDGAMSPGSFTYDGQISDRVSHAYRRFSDAGLPHHVASALVGNMMQESGAEINPAAVGDNGNAFGSGQWNGDRRHGYMAYARSKESEPTNFDTQIDWLLHEGKTTEKKAWDAIMATETVEDAARVASEKFWRPGAPHLANRIGYATAVYDKFYQPESGGPTKRFARGIKDPGEPILKKFYRVQNKETS